MIAIIIITDKILTKTNSINANSGNKNRIPIPIINTPMQPKFELLFSPLFPLLPLVRTRKPIINKGIPTNNEKPISSKPGNPIISKLLL